MASDAVEVDRGAKTRARAAMIAAYDDAVDDSVTPVAQPVVVKQGSAGVAELVRITTTPRPRLAWGVAAFAAAAAVLVVVIAVSIRQPDRIVVTSPPPTAAADVFEATESAAVPVIAADVEAGARLVPGRYRTTLTGAAVAFDLDNDYRLLDEGPDRLVLQPADDPGAGTIVLVEGTGPVGADDLVQWADANGIVADSFGTPVLGVDVPAYRLSAELGDCDFGEPCLDLIAPEQGEPVLTIAGASMLVIEIPLEGRSLYIVVGDATPSTQLHDAGFDLARSLEVGAATG